ncbi:aminotransferase class V-fold PLP-dependent enzyme [Catenulispora subtropica]|uniref:Aminotransferase class V domain-containing protein n=1 Tax=Catenulispora subtropica TaxID=450798 RepID=A0ABP5DE83_9ACTN
MTHGAPAATTEDGPTGSAFGKQNPIEQPRHHSPAGPARPAATANALTGSASPPATIAEQAQSPAQSQAQSQAQLSDSPVESGAATAGAGAAQVRRSPSTTTAAPGRPGPGRAHQITVDSYLSRFAEPDGYLDFARFGPVSSDVASVLERAATTVRVRGWDALDEYDGESERTKSAAGELLACAPHEVGLVSSTSHGLAAAAFALRGPGTVVVARTDFPAAVYPWLRAAERGGLTVRFADGPLTAERLRPLLDESVRAVSVCAVDAGSGFVAPVGELKELIGARRVLVVDAVQALGATPFEVAGADVVAAGGQKFLRAGWGAALLAVRDRVAEFVRPGIGGWAGVDDPLGEAPHPHPPRPGGTAHMFTNPDGPAVAAFGAGLRLVLDTGVERINALIREVVGAVAEAAQGAGAEVETYGGGIMRLRVPGADPDAVHAALADAGLTTTLRGAWIRVSPHASSRPDVADRIGAVLRGVRTG